MPGPGVNFAFRSVTHEMTPPKGIVFTPRETEIVQALLAAQSNKAIAAQLGISEQSVKNRLSQLYRRLGIHSRLELMKVLLKET